MSIFSSTRWRTSFRRLMYGKIPLSCGNHSRGGRTLRLVRRASWNLWIKKLAEGLCVKGLSVVEGLHLVEDLVVVSYVSGREVVR